MDTLDQILRCSFCTKPSTDVDRLISGPGVYICDVCVRLCQDILGEQGPKQVEWKPRWDTMADDELLAALPGIAAAAARIDGDLTTWVGQLRSRNVSWARIGEALGMTRQSAWERFSGD